MINENYKVSILTPVYNVSNYIERCARSLFEQTYDNLEFIFVNDCTPDNSMEILARVIKDYPQRKEQVKIIHNDKNEGLATVRNILTKLADGTFIMHVDSDDWIEKDTTEKLVNKQIQTGADIVSCNGFLEESSHQSLIQLPQKSNPHEMIMEFLKSPNNHQIWGRLIRTSLYNQIEGAKEGLDNGEDTLVTPQLFYYAQKLANVDEPLYHYFQGNKASLTHKEIRNKVNTKARIQVIQNSILVRDFFKGKDKELEEQANRHIAYQIWDSSKHCARRDKQAFKQMWAYRKYVDGNPFLSFAGKWGKLGVFWRSHYYCVSFIR